MDVALDVAGDTIESSMSTTIDTNGNDNTVEENDNMEDNINEAASEDSGMSSVDNHNLSGELVNIPLSLFCLDAKHEQVEMPAIECNNCPLSRTKIDT